LTTIYGDYAAQTRDPAKLRDYVRDAIASKAILAVRRSEHGKIGAERPII
jgi:hypothetical protein